MHTETHANNINHTDTIDINDLNASFGGESDKNEDAEYDDEFDVNEETLAIELPLDHENDDVAMPGEELMTSFASMKEKKNVEPESVAKTGAELFTTIVSTVQQRNRGKQAVSTLEINTTFFLCLQSDRELNYIC